MSTIVEQRTTTTQQATGWKSYKRPHRTRLYLNAVSGEGAREDGTTVHITPGLALHELVESVPADIEVVYLCGTLPSAPAVTSENSELYSPFNSWLLAESAGREHMRLDSGETHDATMIRMRRRDGTRLDVRIAAAWFSTNDLTPQQAASAGMEVTRVLRQHQAWESVYLLDMPARTGLDLWRVSIGFHSVGGIRQPVTYPILDAEIRETIRATEGQGRFELLPQPQGVQTVGGLTYLDGRLRYGAMALMELGIGPATHDSGDGYIPWQPARYRICFTVPDGWTHLGLFMVKDGPMRRSRKSGGWYYPREPGTTHETWADASELRNALGPFPHMCEECERCWRSNDGTRCQVHGWPVQILERIIYTKSRPLSLWAERLISARERCTSEHARAAIRNILLHSIGALHGTTRPVTRITTSAADTPDHTPLHVVLDSSGNEVYMWEEAGQAPEADCNHPELSSQVWDRARAHLLLHRDYDTKQYVGALTLPFETVVSLRLDAIYTTVDPGWPDRGRSGTLRIKGHVVGPIEWPRTEDDIAGLKVALIEEKLR